MVELFGEDDTRADLEYKIKLTSSRLRQEVNRDIVMHIIYRFPRQTLYIDANTVSWFNKIVCNIQQYDIDTESMLLRANGLASYEV